MDPDRPWLPGGRGRQRGRDGKDVASGATGDQRRSNKKPGPMQENAGTMNESLVPGIRGRGRGRGQSQRRAAGEHVVPFGQACDRRELFKETQPSEGQQAAAGKTASIYSHSYSEAVLGQPKPSLQCPPLSSVKPDLEAQNDGESSSDDDLDDEKGQQLFDFTFKQYFHTKDSVDGEDVERTRHLVLEMCEGGAVTCLICLASVRRVHPLWSCESCFAPFHLSCVQKWARDSMELMPTVLSQKHFPNRTQPWLCPKCRASYPEPPLRYHCFCGQVEEPKPDPWLTPHSCGQICNRTLKPSCGHRCLLLCHPGPCPPCPVTVQSRCHCGKATPMPRRCGHRAWSCGAVCEHKLNCGQHSCDKTCHPGECLTCVNLSIQPCLCGHNQKQRPCASPSWQCQRVCGKQFSCGVHTCQMICHSGACLSCPTSGLRTCPCGKTPCELPCTEEPPTCGDTCAKPLACGQHRCNQRCHRGPCETCRQVVDKSCRCGRHTRSTQCSRPYLCDTRCIQLRPCGRHTCRRKCCIGDCPPCDQPCGRLLQCKTHRCPSLCHPGRCYPCVEEVTVRCACGFSSINVSCGCERNTRPPRCNQLCSSPPICHHPKRAPHRCHPWKCPPCQLPCNRMHKDCGHLCPDPCHDAVLVTPAQPAISGPWEKIELPRPKIQAQPCSPCKVPVPVSCLGKHEVSTLPCQESRPYSCGRPCGKFLPCGNHTCQEPCHAFADGRTPPDDQRPISICPPCEVGCLRPRLEGCPHQCTLPCHPGPCPTCCQIIKVACHCKLTLLHLCCSKLVSASEEKRASLLSCSNRCPLELPCGHRCKATCHAGPCPDPETCLHRVKIRCSCRRLKKEAACWRVQQGLVLLDCDSECRDISNKAEKQRKLEEQDRLEAERCKMQVDVYHGHFTILCTPT
uniref:Nuclear transcription factor, X-box binding-like 1 n=2 Tax=Eptatretus burgeri TaxID=7764 RepID=A0A8C4QJ29_EPTBU